MIRGYLNIRSNIAQVILIVLLLPVLAVICWVVCGSNAASSFNDFLMSLIEQIPSVTCGSRSWRSIPNPPV